MQMKKKIEISKHFKNDDSIIQTEYRWIEIKAIHDQKHENYVKKEGTAFFENNLTFNWKENLILVYANDTHSASIKK